MRKLVGAIAENVPIFVIKMNLAHILGILFASLTIGLFSSSHEDHGIYVSVIKIKQLDSTSEATMNIRVFADDLKSALRNQFGYEAITGKPTFCEDYNTYIEEYFRKYLSCIINDETVTFQLNDCEKTEDVYQLSFHLVTPTEWKSVQLEVPFFMELFPNQSNIVHLEANNQKRFGRATKGNERLRMRLWMIDTRCWLLDTWYYNDGWMIVLIVSR